ncbi:MAG: hypothetical protein WDZ59_06035 [Pirellulales bacterium]
MSFRNWKILPPAAVLLFGLAMTAPARAEFVIPDGSTAPFAEWSRGDANSVYAEWDVFTVPYGEPGNAPDVGSSPTGGSPSGEAARLIGHEETAFLSGGGNIYSFAAPTDFTANVSGHNNGANWDTRVVAQVRTLGSPLDLNSVQLTYNDGSNDIPLMAAQYAELSRVPLGGFGGDLVDHMFVFDIGGFNPSSVQFDFTAESSSMSLDRLAVDTYAFAAPVDDPATIEGRFIYYRNSVFDTSPTVIDGAIAPDKVALLPGEMASSANYTNYTRGINGLAIDVSGLAGTPTLEDFVFKVGNDNLVDAWEDAAPPESLTVLDGAGVDGADRILLTWADEAVYDTWLQVSMLASENTGLSEPDVFYFGNAPGDGSGGSDAAVGPADELGARNNIHGFGNRALIDDPWDYNRDRLVDVVDQLFARNNPTGFLDRLRLIAPPGPVSALRSGDLHAVPEPNGPAMLISAGMAIAGALGWRRYKLSAGVVS